jgi:hypothetical protein
MITMVVIMLAMNVAMAMTQGALLEVNPSGEVFFDVAASPYANYASDTDILVDDSYIPQDTDIEADTSGNVFSDTYKTMKSWVQITLEPLGFIVDILKQPYGFLTDLDVPPAIALAVGAIWYIIALLVFVSWLMGRS